MKHWIRSHFEPEPGDDFCLSVFLRWVSTLFGVGVILILLAAAIIALLVYLPDAAWLINVLKAVFRAGAYLVAGIGIIWVILALWWRE
jgi:hypothetical protein